METNIISHTIDSGLPGPTLVLLGAVHGNEKCGPAALDALLKKFSGGDLALTAGKLIVVPIANPGAYAANTRFVDRNLNRGLTKKNPQAGAPYEDFLCNALCAVLDQADYLLDIHSYTSPGGPFVFIGCRDAEEKAFAEALGVTKNFVWDWENAFQDSGTAPEESRSTTGYARSVAPQVRALTLECGQHSNANNADIGFAASLRAMAHLGIVAPEAAEYNLRGVTLPPVTGEKFYARMKDVVFNNNGMTMTEEFNHFSRVREGQVLARDNSSREVIAPKDGFIILPKPDVAPGGELFYFGVAQEPYPASKAKSYCK